MALPSPVKFTSQALEKIKSIRQSEKIAETLKLRVGIKGGGCSGVGFMLGFDDPTEQDQHFDIDQMDVIVDPAHAMHILGLEIDWVENDEQQGFVFNDDKASKP